MFRHASGLVAEARAAAASTLIGRWQGGKHRLPYWIAASVDPFLYAGIVTFVLASVTGKASFERFQLTLIGFVAFLWTLRCVIAAIDVPELFRRLDEAGRHPTATALVSAMVTPTVIFLVSLCLAALAPIFVRGSLPNLGSIVWLIPAVLTHAVWNIVFVLAIGIAFARGWVRTPTLIFGVAGVAFVVSPVGYQLGDLPQPASALLTSLNPGAHLLAAYHNALWFDQPVSLKVLPLAALIGIGVAMALTAALPHRPLRRGEPAAPQGLLLLVRLDPELEARDALALAGVDSRLLNIYQPWSGRLGAWTGESLVRLLLAVRAGTASRLGSSILDVGARSGTERLLGEQLNVYPRWALAQLGYTVALSDGGAIAIDRLLDDATDRFVLEQWGELAVSAQRRCIVVIADRLLPIAAPIAGRAVIIGGRAILASGLIDGRLLELYRSTLERVRSAAGPVGGSGLRAIGG